jgi:hypothetical protein
MPGILYTEQDLRFQGIFVFRGEAVSGAAKSVRSLAGVAAAADVYASGFISK